MELASGGRAQVGFHLPLWSKVSLFGIAYFACAWTGRLLSFQPRDAFVSFWLPSGLFLAALLRVETRLWPLFVAAGAAANLAFDLTNQRTVVTALVFAAGNVLEAVSAAWLIRTCIALRPTFDSLKDVAGVVGFSAFSTALNAGLTGAAVMLTQGRTASVAAWLQWWFGDWLAVMLVAPLMLGPLPDLAQIRESRAKRWEAMALAAGFCASLWLVSVRELYPFLPIGFLLAVLVVWSGLRFGGGITSFFVLMDEHFRIICLNLSMLMYLTTLRFMKPPIMAYVALKR